MGVFYYQRFFYDFSYDAYRNLDIAQNFIAQKRCTINYLPLPGLVQYDKWDLLYKEHWPCLFGGPFLGFSLASITRILNLSLEVSYLFLALAVWMAITYLAFRFFSRFLPLSLSFFATLFLIINWQLISLLFSHLAFLVNLLFFLFALYLLEKRLSGWNIIFASIALGINYYNSYLSLLLFIVFFTYIFLKSKKQRKERLLLFAIIFFLIVAPYFYIRYQYNQNPFYAFQMALDFLSYTSHFPGRSINHILRGVAIWDYFTGHPKEILLKFFTNLKLGLTALTEVPGNYLLFGLGFAGFFYRFRRFRKLDLRFRILDRKFLGLSFAFYFLPLLFFGVEIENMLIYLPLLLVWGLGFLILEMKRRGRRVQRIACPLFLAFLILVSIYPFVSQKIQEKEIGIEQFEVMREANAINLGPPKLAFKTGVKTFALPPMPRYIEDIERDYDLEVYSVYISKEIVENNDVLRLGGWDKILGSKTLPDFELAKEFPNGDLYFVRKE